MANFDLKSLHFDQFQAPAEEERLVPLLWHKGEPWVEDIRRRLAGWCSGSSDWFFIARDGQRLVGHVWYTVSQARPWLGLLGHVFTAPEFRQRGIASRLITAALAQFTSDGGQVMQLFTYSPETLPLYQRLGFQIIHGGSAGHARDWAMRRPADGHAILDSWLAESLAPPRPLAPDDLPSYCLLYNLEFQTALKDRAQGIGLGLESELAFLQSQQRLWRGSAAIEVLDNGRMLCGVASLVACDFPHQSHLGLVDYYLPPAYRDRAAELLDAVLQRRESIGLEQVYALVVDESKHQVVRKFAGEPIARLTGGYVAEGIRRDGVLYHLPSVR